jgi:hypothetical protein
MRLRLWIDPRRIDKGVTAADDIGFAGHDDTTTQRHHVLQSQPGAVVPSRRRVKPKG